MGRRLLTVNADIRCSHAAGVVQLAATQTWVTIGRRPILVARDPETRPVAGCPVASPNKPCTSTLAVTRGYSSLLAVEGRAICLDTVTGSTDGTLFPAEYSVAATGQTFVEGEE